MEGITTAMQRATLQCIGWTHGVAQAFEQRKHSVKEFVEIWMKVRLKENAAVLVDMIPGYVKQKLYDPYMPRCIRAALHRTINRVWPDVKHEIMWEVSVIIDGNEQAYEVELSNKAGSCCLLAFFRYRLFPCDKGIWQCLRDPVFLFVNILCCVPVYGIWAWMFLLIFFIIDKKDEYQLVSFILTFKGCQFFSWGIIKGLVGFLQYFYCVTFPRLSEVVATGEREIDPGRCMTDGPGMGEEYVILVASWLLPLVLVWICMILLPYAEEKGRDKLKILHDEVASFRSKSEQLEVGGRKKKPREACTKSGGYLQGIVIFDSVIFVLCVGILCIIAASQPHATGTVSKISKMIIARDSDWQVKQTFYCVQFIYGLFSVVFVPFKLPFLQAVLTHTVPTAYDNEGRCCKFKGVEPPKSEQEDEDGIRRVSTLLMGKEQVDSFMRDLKTAMAGSVTQGSQTSVRNQAGTLVSDHRVEATENPKQESQAPEQLLA